jgi:branched-chain amino acid transport system ATP-binding protein
MKPILEVRDLHVSYGAIKALKGVSITVPEKSIVALLGANGAGKSTLLRTISGVVKAQSGHILLEGEEITHLPIYAIAGKGIVQSPEGRQIFAGLTVEENLKVGAYALKGRVTVDKDGIETRISKSEQMAKNLDLVYKHFPILKDRRAQQANTLSGGEQQMLAIGRALMASPTVFLLDEPSLGLAPLIVRDIFAIIQELKQEGNTILIVEQNAYQTLKIADYAYVLELGKVSMQGTGQELLKNEKLIEAYLGEKTTSTERK